MAEEKKIAKKYTCWVCSKEIPNNFSVYAFTIDFIDPSVHPRERIHLCGPCKNDIWDYIVRFKRTWNAEHLEQQEREAKDKDKKNQFKPINY